MKKFGDFICKNKIAILILSLILLIPSLIGMVKTKINYDILVYLPDNIETIQGQNILTDEFNMGAYSIAVIDNMPIKDILKTEEELRKIDGVEKVITLNDLTGTTIPLEIVSNEIIEKVNKGDSSLMFITFKDSTSAESTLTAVENVREVVKDNCQIGGMSSMVLDTMNLSNQEVLIYIVIAVILCIVVLMISLDSYLVPVILLGNIGVAILFNMGSNIILGNISYITKAISAVLQLGVTTDFSIFLYHKYEKNKSLYKNKDEAMSKAIAETLVSVLGSSLTTIAGFLALCTMTLTLGTDIGLVMAKGVLLGVICVVTLFPSLLLVLDKYIEKTKHKKILPEFKHVNRFVTKHYKTIFVTFLILLVPAIIGNKNVDVYYNLDKSLPETLESSVANRKLKEDFNIVSPEMILVDKNLSNNQILEMTNNIEKIDGIDFAISYANMSELNIPLEFLPEDVKSIFESDNYKLILVNSLYSTATDELNNQIDEVVEIVKQYDKDAIVAGEGPLMKDLVEISDRDFKNVNVASIAVIFIIMIFVLKSYTLPILLVAAIEFAIFVNMSVPFYTESTIPFIASIVIGTIQLGATIDYAILMTTKYLEERKSNDKFTAINTALDSSVNSIFVSGMCFFAATFGVGIYSKLEMIGSLCTLISRGAVISMLVVVLVLPSILLLFDKLIIKTTKGFKEMKPMKNKKVVASLLVISAFAAISPVKALTKDETTYTKLNANGTIKKTIVTEHLINNEKEIEDLSILSNIANSNGDETFSQKDKSLIWDANGKDIYYQGTIEKDLPIKTEINYSLDEKSMKVEDMLGKSGKVSIQIKFTNSEQHTVKINGKSETMYTPFIVTFGTIIPTESTSNIEVTNGKVVTNGTNNVVVSVASPGLSESLQIANLNTLDEITLTYDTTNFELGSMYFVATPKIIESSDLKVFDKLDAIYSKVDTLTSSTNQLIDGSKQLEQGNIEYNKNFNEYNLNMQKFATSANQLSNGYSSVSTGIKTLNGGLTKLKTLSSSLDTLETSIKQLAAVTNQIATQTEELDELISNTTSALQQHIVALQKIIATTTDETTKVELTKELQTLSTSLDLEGLSNVTTNVKELNKNVQTLNVGMSILNSSTSTLKTAINALADGSDKLVAGDKTISDSLKLISSSATTLAGYSNSFYEASNEMTSGATTLRSGLEQYNEEGISVIANYINGELKTAEIRVKELVKLSNEYDSFAGKTSETESTTKFISIVDSQKLVVKEEVKETETKKDSIWQKFLNLFK